MIEAGATLVNGPKKRKHWIGKGERKILKGFWTNTGAPTGDSTVWHRSVEVKTGLMSPIT